MKKKTKKKNKHIDVRSSKRTKNIFKSISLYLFECESTAASDDKDRRTTKTTTNGFSLQTCIYSYLFDVAHTRVSFILSKRRLHYIVQKKEEREYREIDANKNQTIVRNMILKMSMFERRKSPAKNRLYFETPERPIFGLGECTYDMCLCGLHKFIR